MQAVHTGDELRMQHQDSYIFPSSSDFQLLNNNASFPDERDSLYVIVGLLMIALVVALLLFHHSRYDPLGWSLLILAV